MLFPSPFELGEFFYLQLGFLCNYLGMSNLDNFFLYFLFEFPQLSYSPVYSGNFLVQFIYFEIQLLLSFLEFLYPVYDFTFFFLHAFAFLSQIFT